MGKTSKTQAAGVRKMKVLFGALVPLLLTTGCAGMSNTDKGLLAGAGIGAGIGAVVGSAFHSPAAGAAIGGMFGGATGAVVGNEADVRQERREVQQAVATQAAVQAEAQRRWLSLEDVQRLSANGTNDTIIINQIRTTGTVFHLTAPQIEWLQQYGVHDSVITEMQATATRPSTVVYPAGPPQTIIVEERPPVSVRIGGGFYRYR